MLMGKIMIKHHQASCFGCNYLICRETLSGNIIELLPGMFMEIPATFDCRKLHERTSSEKAKKTRHPNII